MTSVIEEKIKEKERYFVNETTQGFHHSVLGLKSHSFKSMKNLIYSTEKTLDTLLKQGQGKPPKSRFVSILFSSNHFFGLYFSFCFFFSSICLLIDLQEEEEVEKEKKRRRRKKLNFTFSLSLTHLLYYFSS